VGGYAVVATGGATGTAARRIVSNTAGWWLSGSGQPEVRILLDLDAVDGTEDASGAVTLVWPSGVLVVHSSSLTTVRRWRVRIAASQVTPDAYYQVGICAPLALRLLGAPPDWGWSHETAANAATTRSRYGTTRVREQGPTITTWRYGWADGVDLRTLRGAGSSVDWVGSSVGYTAGSTQAEDVPWLLRGLLEHSGSGEVPVLALASVPDASGGTITDRTQYLYGRLTTSIRSDHLVGTEGSSELVRVGEIAIEEIV
jgi:hypothetical protein